LSQQRDDEPAKPYKFEFTEIQAGPVDLTEPSLVEAAIQAGLPHFHTLLVAPNLRIEATRLGRQINAAQLGNPLCPYLNIQVEPTMIGNSWCLVTNGKAFGSKGY
jgi:hypothetical protein